MSSKNIIAVTGATGLQGGSAAKFLLDDGTFAVRAITRNPNSPAAKELSARGAQVVKADLRDPASLVKALEGAYGVFGLTNFWEPGVGEGEIAQGKALVDAAKATGVKHLVWSTLDRTQFKGARHWESKADVDDHLKASGVPRTSIYTAFYFENFMGMLQLRRRPDGEFDFPLPMPPDAPIATYSAKDTGAWALAAFKNPNEWLNKDMRIAAEFISVREMAKAMTDAVGKTVHVQEVSQELYETFKDNPIPSELHANGNALMHYNKPPFRDPALAKKLYPGMMTFRAWAQANAKGLVPA